MALLARPTSIYGAEPRVFMQTWTLSFSSTSLEEQYSVARFRSQFAPFAAFCTVTIVLLVMAAVMHPDFAQGYVIAVVCYSGVLGVRVRVDRMADQQVARVRFAQIVNLWSILSWLGAIAWCRINPPKPSGPSIVSIVSVMWALLPPYLRLTAYPKNHYLLNLALNFAGVLGLPTWSTLGWPAEPLGVLAGLVIGDLVGFTLEHHGRKDWLARQQLQEMAAEASSLPELRALLDNVDGVKRFDVRGWERVCVLGRGRYGVAVLLRSQEDVQKACVSKKIATDGMGAEELEVIANEMQVASSLDHPFLIPFWGYYIDSASACCLVLEYCPGGTLQQLIETHAQAKDGFATSVVQRWLAQLASALSYMHAQRVVHRDVKAGNIFLSHDKHDCKLGDFGIAKVVSTVSSGGRTVCGTPANMCPEVLRGLGCGPPGDAWAIGIVLFQMLTLRAPFTLPANANFVALMKIISEFDGTLDAAAAAALDACLHPPSLRKLASGHSLLHPETDERTTLAQVAELLPGYAVKP